jgi:hypothetical protein
VYFSENAARTLPVHRALNVLWSMPRAGDLGHLKFTFASMLETLAPVRSGLSK